MKLKVKFFIFLVGIPSVALIFFLVVALRIFIQDKSLGILEANMTLASSIANQLEYMGVEKSLGAFNQMGIVQAFVFGTDRKIVISSIKENVGQDASKILSVSILEHIVDSKVLEGSFEDKTSKGEADIFNFIKLPKLNLVLLLATPKESAFRASLLFITKALMTFVLLVLVAILLSWLLSLSMTRPLVTLMVCMQKFSRGDFTVMAPIRGRDEIGILSHYFNKMVKQIQGLIVDREGKLKFEVEMNLASDIQKKLFPPESFIGNSVEFSGFYEPASNCGGDWWFYFKYGNYFVTCIGDVTGHGVHSALLTSACRAAFSIISKNFEGTAVSMGILNQCIYETVQGSINMTCILAALDTASGQLTYTNASHESPVVLPNKSGRLKKKDFTFLPEIHGPRLGQEASFTYTQSETTILPNQHIFFYSDGLIDINSPKKEKLGERRLMNFLGDNFQLSQNVDQEKRILIKKLEDYRIDEPLVDDLSFFFMKWVPNV